LWKRRTAAWSRWLHIYLSMSSFAILFFFAITGVTLNHTDWFAQHQSSRQIRGSMNPQWLQPEVRKLEIAEKLRQTHGIRSAITDFRIDDGQVSVSFKGPGYSADAFIDRAAGTYECNETTMGLVAILNDLHKGRDTGKVWSAVIDVSAILMVLVSLSGMVLIFFLHKRLVSGLFAVVGGGLASYLLYRFWVP
jgi:hypothetical protein